MTNDCTLIATGAPLARRTHDIASALQTSGWTTTVIATPSASAWLDVDAITAVTGTPPRNSHRSPTTAKRGPLPELVIVCPATFNTLAKAALGIADTYTHSLLCETIGAGIPMLCVPMINDRLWGHPALDRHLRELTSAGVQFVNLSDGSSTLSPVPSGTGEALINAFDPQWLVTRADRVR